MEQPSDELERVQKKVETHSNLIELRFEYCINFEVNTDVNK